MILEFLFYLMNYTKKVIIFVEVHMHKIAILLNSYITSVRLNLMVLSQNENIA